MFVVRHDFDALRLVTTLQIWYFQFDSRVTFAEYNDFENLRRRFKTLFEELTIFRCIVAFLSEPTQLQK